MSGAKICCYVCGTDLTLEGLLANAEDRAAWARLFAMSTPLGAALGKYTSLFTPPKSSLTHRKQLAIALQLLPDLERNAITHRGRDWAVPNRVWLAGIDQMLALRDAGKLDLPMKGHGYLYAILVSLADKVEAAAEVQAEAARRRPVSQVAGQGATNAAPIPEAVRAQIATLKHLGVKA
ncbi:MAG: hypothetical protein PHH58_17660 [Rhodoferax sp.]|nr:hypothetical protein [Rhodoferax sp.]